MAFWAGFGGSFFGPVLRAGSKILHLMRACVSCDRAVDAVARWWGPLPGRPSPLEALPPPQDTQAKAAQTTQALQQQTADLDREWQRRLDCLAAECLAALGDGPEAQHCLRQRLAAAGLPLSEGGRRGV